MDAAHARATLARTPGLTAEAAGTLIASAGGDLAAASLARAAARVELPPAARAYLRSPDERAVAADLDWLASSGTVIVLCTDPGYPPLLKAAAGAPAALYVQGSVALLATRQLAMVGSRSPTPAGRSTAREFAAWFARAGFTVTSGLATGIDAASHEGALKGGGATIAVFGTGLDQVYPSVNRALAERIRTRGALVSELAPGTAPLPGNFPRRNRIIAALALGTLVVEAARFSGSLTTARHALEADREVFAIPGSIHSPLSYGCHQLIKAGATLVAEAADVTQALGFSVPKERLSPAAARGEGGHELDKEYEMLLDALGFAPASIDSLVARTELPSESIASMLLILELEGRVAALPGGRFGRIP
ncbi:MAG TPA: DNA-processing protein DprA [Steroidobacteraceae bacterium]|nr:DNA-processing protein DprA [Steroidobacteraceae bacterium]